MILVALSSVLRLTIVGYRVDSGVFYPDACAYWSSTVSIGCFITEGSSQTIKVETTTSLVSANISGMMKKYGC